MNKSNNIINFYMMASELKNIVRTGWKELDISADRLESVAEHIYGSLVLAIAIDSEYDLDLDMLKVFKMLIIKDLEKVSLKNFVYREYDSQEARKEKRVQILTEMTKDLVKKDELLSILDEYNNKSSKEAVFVYELIKIESDMQAKRYDLDGKFDLEKAKEDIKFYGDPVTSEVLPNMNNASDGWILFNRRYYTLDIFKELSNTIQNYKD